MTAVVFILISLIMTSVLLAVIFYIAWNNFGKKKYALIWCYVFVIGAVQWSINLSSSILFSDQRIYWLTVNFFSVCLISLAFYGHRLRVERYTSIKLLLITASSVYSLVVWFTVFQPHVGLKMFIIPMYSAVILFWIALLIIKYRSHPTAPEWGACTTYALFSLTQLFAAVAVLMQGATSAPYYFKIYQTINFTILPSGYIGTGMFMVFILAADMSHNMKTLAMTDPLTSVLNRRGFYDAAVRAVALSYRQEKNFSLILADIDHFKEVNDKYGHYAGDLALGRFVKCVKSVLREHDIFGRVGGEEFLIFLLDTDTKTAITIAERIRVKLEQSELKYKNRVIRMTASFGLTEVNYQLMTLEKSVEQVDKAMYIAKNSGRNQIKVMD